MISPIKNPSDFKASVKFCAALYIGYPLNALTVIMESGQKATYYNLPSGTFLPISCLTVCNVDAAGEEPPSPGELKQYILALF